MSRSAFPARTLISLLALSTFAATSQAAPATDDAQRVEELEQRLLVLERKLEIQQEDAATKAKDTPTVTAGEKGFSLKKGDYEIKFNALAQIDGRYFLDDDGAFRDGFQTRRLRPTIQGSLGKLVAFRFTPEFAGSGFGDVAGSNSIVDAYFDLKFSPYASLRVGKQKGPVGLERLQSGGSIEFIERGFPTELVPNRDLGVAVFGEALKSTVSYTVGVFNGTADGRDISTLDDGLKEVEGRVFFEPFKNDYGVFKGLGFGIAGSTGAKDSQPSTPASANPANANSTLARLRTPGQNQFFGYDTGVFASGKHSRYVPQAYFYYNALGLLGEYAVSEQDVTRAGVEKSIKNDAYSVTASYVLTGEDASYRGVKPGNPYTVGGDGWGAVELVARIGALDVDNGVFTGTSTGATANRLANPDTQASKATSYGLGINWYLNNNAKLSADYNETSFDGGGAAGADRRDEKALFTRLTIQY